jgi:hypothetical protein
MKKIFLTAILFSGLTLSACRSNSPAATATPTPELTVASATPAPKKKAEYEFVATQSGQVALDLIQSQAEVETKDYGAAGKFVTSINGLAGDNNFYWAFYLNDKYAEKGASQTTLKKDDKIKFVYEAVSPTK